MSVPCQVPVERRRQVAAALKAGLPDGAVLSDPEDTRPYECDGLAAYRQLPMIVALPMDEEQVLAVLDVCRELQVPVVPRGAGTGLSGGALPIHDGVVLSTARLNRVNRVDDYARTAVVQPGVRNLAISEVAAQYGLYYAPDPSSQIACTIGGNVAENSGGVHCLKYGLTVPTCCACAWPPSTARSSNWAARRWTRRAWICSPSSSARKACSASSPK